MRIPQVRDGDSLHKRICGQESQPKGGLEEQRVKISQSVKNKRRDQQG